MPETVASNPFTRPFPSDTFLYMGTSGPIDEWKRVAEAVARRREQRGWTQADVAARGGLSLDRVQAVEAGRGENLRVRTLISLTRGLEWSINSVDRIMKGLDPVPIESLRGEGLLREAIWIIGDVAAIRSRSHVSETKDRIWAAIAPRLVELRLTRKQLAWRADLDPLNVLDGHLSPRGAERLAQSLAGALQWTEDSVLAVANGEKPKTLPYPVLYPSEFDRAVEPMQTPALDEPGVRQWTKWKAAVNDDIQAGWAKGLSALIPTSPPYDDVRAILESGLPSHMQRNLISHMAMRRAQADAMLRGEAQMLIEQLKLGTQDVPANGQSED